MRIKFSGITDFEDFPSPPPKSNTSPITHPPLLADVVIDPPEPLVVVLEDGEVFRKSEYLTQGFNRIEIMCIGAAGGAGGILDHGEIELTHPEWIRYYRASFESELETVDSGPSTLTRTANYARLGAAGGGGGLHRVRGRLSRLPREVQVVVGEPGENGVESDPGEDGGTSSFGTTCKASGGKGGGAYTGTIDFRDTAPRASAEILGGEGGKGNTDVAGGGANAGRDGTWDGTSGEGGGGGGYYYSTVTIPAFPSYHYFLSLDGSDGSQSTTDPNKKGVGGTHTTQVIPQEEFYVTSTTVEIVATTENGGEFQKVDYFGVHDETTTAEETFLEHFGAGGGARTLDLDGDTAQYGSYADNPEGRVVVRLTYVG